MTLSSWAVCTVDSMDVDFQNSNAAQNRWSGNFNRNPNFTDKYFLDLHHENSMIHTHKLTGKGESTNAEFGLSIFSPKCRLNAKISANER